MTAQPSQTPTATVTESATQTATVTHTATETATVTQTATATATVTETAGTSGDLCAVVADRPLGSVVYTEYADGRLSGLSVKADPYRYFSPDVAFAALYQTFDSGESYQLIDRTLPVGREASFVVGPTTADTTGVTIERDAAVGYFDSNGHLLHWASSTWIDPCC
ncbi:MAG: hypothetical protein F2667_04715 [Actinobacteria bacterium]|nr:hypothetical protein [Actinomycetota bacterium]